MDEVEGGPPVPVEWFVSVVAEAFGCTPSVARAEIERDPRLVLDVLDLRRYARAKVEVEHATKDSEASEWAKKWVFDIQHERQKRMGPRVT